MNLILIYILKLSLALVVKSVKTKIFIFSTQNSIYY